MDELQRFTLSDRVAIVAGGSGGEGAARPDADPARAARHDGDAVGEGEALQFVDGCLVHGVREPPGSWGRGGQRTGARLAVNLSQSEAAFSVWMWSIM